MNPFQSMTHAIAYMAVTVFLLLWYALRANPLAAAGSFVRELAATRKYLLHFIVMMAVLYMNKIELRLEERMAAKPDFTPFIARLDGEFIAFVQHAFYHPLLTYAAVYAYVVMFPAFIIAAVAIYTHSKQPKLVCAICYALIFNYTLAIPFYLFFPVSEVWAYHPHVKFLMLDAFPRFEAEYRPLSGLNNCFPSLHTSISVSMALIAFKSNNSRWSGLAAAVTVCIVFAIFYLGIHWLLDMCGGLLLGYGSAAMALRLSEGKFPIGEYTVPWRKQRMMLK
ncbi:phosphoesterase PA-phosphatase [Gordoniibacillus kamchatkensis]|uniref:Phosphoesterase PA-phosphatase n=1 Tax=Gordoniibacillus kamchatkensis TaxID=1590651 RepID=A0ABR5AJ12_9BACL|nr:phosphatase PAP2 family protein [Paenibacillus sp. VKM B-2647]KIL41039.1 phosphoesterase PA-phosphatase [Paenibacillus sp. VKM B-2647]